jgi:hypothetical protein
MRLVRALRCTRTRCVTQAIVAFRFDLLLAIFLPLHGPRSLRRGGSPVVFAYLHRLRVHKSEMHVGLQGSSNRRRVDLPGFLGGSRQQIRSDGEINIWSCCFPYKGRGDAELDSDQDDPFRTPPNGLNIEEKHYRRGSPRRRRDPTFNVLCQVREALIENYCLPQCILDPDRIARNTKPLFDFFGLEQPPTVSEVAVATTSSRRIDWRGQAGYEGHFAANKGSEYSCEPRLGRRVRYPSVRNARFVE